MKAKYIGRTINRAVKDRWECPFCREHHAPECRFNLDPKKTGTNYNCRFCGTLLELIK
jgi:transcription elongation factor Elf1